MSAIYIPSHLLPCRLSKLTERRSSPLWHRCTRQTTHLQWRLIKIRMTAAAPAVHEGRAVRSCQLLLNLQTLRYSDSGSIQYLVDGPRVPHPVGRTMAQREELGSRAEETKNIWKMGPYRRLGGSPISSL